MNVLILGAGGHGHVVADVLFCMQRAGQAVVPIGYLDDDPGLSGQVRLELGVLGSLSAIKDIPHDAIILGIGNNRVRKRLYESFKQHGEQFVCVVHPRSVLAYDAQVGPGSVVCANVVVNPGTVVGANVILNTGCTVDHHNYIQAHAHIAPGVHLGGDVVVGEGALVGIGAVVMPQRSVGDWAIVGAGAVVTRDVPASATVVGVPARSMR